MSKPSLRLQLTKLLLYHILLWQLGRWPQSKFHCRADGDLLPADEVSALRDFMSNTELRPEQIIEVTYCSDVVQTYGFVIECNCTNESECRITGIMSYLGLTGTIHESVGNLTSLTYLILSNNTLHGGIPDTFGNLKNLQVLDLSRNQLSGSIPASLGRLVSLEYLYLQYNLLSQGIPPRSFGSLTKLTELNLQFNMLSDSIPEDFGNLSSLTIMDLSENQLSGALPESLRKLKNLRTFYVSANNLSEEFPKGYDQLTSLKKFSIAGNYISGPLPVETIAKWTNITHLVLVGNNFEGNLKTEIFGLQNLQYLLISDLANNSFQLPPKIANSAKFISLTLRNCSITGPIPKYIGEEMTSLRYLDLSFNKLTGGLPQNMSSNMIDMSFAGNMLDGTIPPWILLNGTIAPWTHGDFQTRIDLSFNKFSAGDLSFNNFSAGGSPVPSNQQLNLFACCRNSSTNEPVMMENRYCPENNPKYHSLFINCGGEETTVLGNKYDQDNDTSLYYTSPKENWAYSLSGGYGVPESNTSNYIKSMTGVPTPLFEKARLSPVSLKYYAFCLRKGNYTVTLYFNEVVYTKKEDYASLRKRVFDVYIQDVRRLNYFNIREEEGSTERPITKKISAVVVNDSGLLNIHLYWPGKGSFQYLPSFNGPLISAISVTPEFKISSDKNNGQRVALITLASIVAALPLSLAFAWKMGWLPSPSKSISKTTALFDSESAVVKEGDTEQQAANQSQSAIFKEGDTEKYGNEERQQQPQSVRRGKSSDEGSAVAANQSKSAVVEEGDAEQQAANQSQSAVVEEGDVEQQTANQSQSAVVEEGDTEKYGNEERQQQPQSVRRGKSSDEGSAVAANQSKSAVVEEGDTEKYGNKERQQQRQGVRRGKSSDKGSAVFGEGAAKFLRSNMGFPLEIEESINATSPSLPTFQDLNLFGNVQQDCKQQAANQFKSAVVEEGDTEKYGNKERQQQPQGVRRGKSSDKGSVVFGEGAAKFLRSNMGFPLEIEESINATSPSLPAFQDLNPFGNVQQDCKQQTANQSQSVVVEEGDTEKYGNEERQQQPQSVRRGKSSDEGSAVAANQSKSAVVEEGDAEQQAANQSQSAVVEEGDVEQQTANQSQSAVVEEGDTEKYGNEERQQQPQSVRRGKSSDEGSAVAANQSKSAVVEEGDTEKYGNKEWQQQPQGVRRGKSSDKGSAVFGEGAAKFFRSNMGFPLEIEESINATSPSLPAFQDLNLFGNVQQDCKQHVTNQFKSAVVEEGDTEKYGNKERQQQPQGVRRGKSSDKGSAVFGEGAAKFLHSNMGFPLEIEESINATSPSLPAFQDLNPFGNVQQDCKQQAANQSKSAVVEEGDTEKYGNKERQQQQPQGVRRGKSNDKGSAVFGEGAAKFLPSNMGFPLEIEESINATSPSLPAFQDLNPFGNVQQDCKQQAANQSKSAVVEEGDTEKYGNKERQQQPQSVRRGKSSDKGSVLFGEKIIDEVCPPAKPTGDINVVGSLEESAGISDIAESLSPPWGS